MPSDIKDTRACLSPGIGPNDYFAVDDYNLAILPGDRVCGYYYVKDCGRMWYSGVVLPYKVSSSGFRTPYLQIRATLKDHTGIPDLMSLRLYKIRQSYRGRVNAYTGREGLCAAKYRGSGPDPTANSVRLEDANIIPDTAVA